MFWNKDFVKHYNGKNGHYYWLHNSYYFYEYYLTISILEENLEFEFIIKTYVMFWKEEKNCSNIRIVRIVTNSD